MNMTNPHGWKARRDRVKKRASHAPDEETREIRRRHLRGESAGTRRVQEPAQQPDNVTAEQSREAVESVVEYRKAPDDMTRDELTAELEAAGQKVGARAKDETLRRRVKELRDADS